MTIYSASVLPLLHKTILLMQLSLRTKSGIEGSSTHLNRDKIESNLSVPGIQGHQENALIKSFEMSPHLICL